MKHKKDESKHNHQTKGDILTTTSKGIPATNEGIPVNPESVSVTLPKVEDEQKADSQQKLVDGNIQQEDKCELGLTNLSIPNSENRIEVKKRINNIPPEIVLKELGKRPACKIAREIIQEICGNVSKEAKTNSLAIASTLLKIAFDDGTSAKDKIKAIQTFYAFAGDTGIGAQFGGNSAPVIVVNTGASTSSNTTPPCVDVSGEGIHVS